jgi:hypothetical protein
MEIIVLIGFGIVWALFGVSMLVHGIYGLFKQETISER